LQWNAFVEVLPLWIAPNMVTLLGFFFILFNVALVVIYMPDLVGPVRHQHSIVPVRNYRRLC
jgi:ethanolaminephosphotransferase